MNALVIRQNTILPEKVGTVVTKVITVTISQSSKKYNRNFLWAIFLNALLKIRLVFFDITTVQFFLCINLNIDADDNKSTWLFQ